MSIRDGCSAKAFLTLRMPRADLASSNPNSLNFPDADVIVAPVVEARGFRVRVSGHALRHLDTSAVREVVRNPRGAERVAAYRGCNSRIAGWRRHLCFGVCDPEGTFSSGPAPSRVYSAAPCPSITAFTVPVNSNSSPPAPFVVRLFSFRIDFGAALCRGLTRCGRNGISCWSAGF